MGEISEAASRAQQAASRAKQAAKSAALQRRIRDTLGEMAELVPARSDTTLQSSVCLVDDVNADGIGELTGSFSKTFEGDRFPMLLDGASGGVLWEGPSEGEPVRPGAGPRVEFPCVPAAATSREHAI